jgi:uncharacterized protein with FMN-binding domain
MRMTYVRKRNVVTALAGISVSLLMASCTSTEERSSPPSNRGAEDSKSTTSEDTQFEEGVFKSTGEYGNLPSHITVTVTLDDDVITEVEVTPHATNPTSLDLQSRFADAVPEVVVGKPIDEVNVGRLAGSSVTPKGFNDAINQIKKQAR